jgi:hypothetical protein
MTATRWRRSEVGFIGAPRIRGKRGDRFIFLGALWSVRIGVAVERIANQSVTGLTVAAQSVSTKTSTSRTPGVDAFALFF